jgi:hypothetical protein
MDLSPLCPREGASGAQLIGSFLRPGTSETISRAILLTLHFVSKLTKGLVKHPLN